MISWQEYLTEAVTLFRKEFEKLSPENQKRIRKIAFKRLPLKPCQIEVLEFEEAKGILWILVHDNRLPDMEFKVHKHVKNLDESEFIGVYKYETFDFLDERWTALLSREALHVFAEESIRIYAGNILSPKQVAEWFLSDAKEALKTE